MPSGDSSLALFLLTGHYLMTVNCNFLAQAMHEVKMLTAVVDQALSLLVQDQEESLHAISGMVKVKFSLTQRA